MKRKIIILSIMLCLALSGIIYANWNDSLQINSRLKTGGLDIENIENFQISLIGHNGYYSLDASAMMYEGQYLLTISNKTDIEGFVGAQPQYENLQISYALIPSSRNTIDKLDVMAEDIIMVADNAPYLKWICRSSNINHMDNKISITHTFTLSHESIVENSDYINSIKNDFGKYQMASIDRWDKTQEKLDQKKLASFINGKEESSIDSEDIDTVRFAEQFFQEYTLDSREVNYSFNFNAVVTQAPQTITSNLFTYGLWTDEVSFRGSYCIDHPELVKNTRYINLEEFEILDMLKDIDETIEEAQTSEFVEASQEDNAESNLNINEASELDIEESGLEGISEVNTDDNSLDEARKIAIEETTLEEAGEIDTEETTLEEASEIDTEETTLEEASEIDTEETTLEEASKIAIEETTLEEASEIDTEETTLEEASELDMNKITGED